MSQLATTPLRTAKQLQKLKEIKKVKKAIRWHEQERKKRQAIANERYESKQTVLSKLSWEKENIQDVKRTALRHAREDWQLGPLRPNRAVGHEADRYGALEPNHLRRPDIPVRVQKNRNEVREKKGLELEYPLVVDDKKYFHIVPDDRVVVLKGREKGKIGVVDNIIEDSHEVVIKDINKHYADSRAWNTPPGETVAPKRETEATILLSDLRLVVPYHITTRNAVGEEKEIYQDVIVDNVLMERHTTGIDPFTGINYGDDEFPKAHRYDPESGLPIFHRYIAGTRSRIPWPWEKEEEFSLKEEKDKLPEEKQGFLAKLRSPIRSFGKWVRRPKVYSPLKKKPTSVGLEELKRINVELARDDKSLKEPKSAPDRKPPDSDDDTGRNLAEPQQETRSFFPTLVYPPHPNEISTELAPYIREKHWADAKDKDSNIALQSAIEKARAEKELEALERKKKQIDAMKTPMQLRWEVEKAKKQQEEAAKPKVEMEMLLAALGKHMQDNGIKMTSKRRKAAGVEEVAEVD